MSSPPSTPRTLPVIQCVPPLGQRHDRLRDVIDGRHAAVRVALRRVVDERIALRDLHQRRRHGDAGADGVDGHAGRRSGELHGQLPAVRFERRLGRADRAIRRDDPRRALAGHGVDLRAIAQQPGAPRVLRPVDEAVGHDVERHLHVLARDAVGRVRVRNGLSVPNASECIRTRT